ncbi:Membrane protein of ER body 1 [Linum grandiflorum]
MAAAVAEQQQEWRVDQEEEEAEPLKGRQQQQQRINPTSYAEAAAMEPPPPSANGNGSHGLFPALTEKPQMTEEEDDEPPVEIPDSSTDTIQSNNVSSEAVNDTNGYTITTTISRTVIVPEEKNKEVVVAQSSTSVGIREVRQETEVVLESVYQKAATQEFFCPNCQSCIQKVVLRDRDAAAAAAAKPAASRPQRAYTFRCADCFAFLIPVGNWIFGSRGQDADDDDIITDQVDTDVPRRTPPPRGSLPNKAPSTVVAPPSAVPSLALPDHGKAQLDGSTSQPKPVHSEIAGQEENGHVSVTSRDPSVTGFDVGFNRPPTGDSEISINNKEPRQPGKDSDNVEVVIDEGKVSVDVTKDKHKGSKGILGVLISKLPGMGAQQLGELNQGLLDVIEDDAHKTGSQLPVSSPTTGEAPAPVPGTSEIVVVTSQPPTVRPPRVAWEWDILKSIVYGGLAELITSLSIVTSAASADTETLKILAIGVANLIGGLFILTTNIWDLRCEQPRKLVTSIETQEEAEVDRYCDNLGKRTNFKRHTFFAVLSFLMFGLVPPVVYGFSFKESDDRDYKIAATAVVSLVCIFLLAIGKAHAQKPPKTYLKSVAFYVTAGVMASGVSFLAGELFKKVMDDLGTFAPVAEAPPAASVLGNWASY